jgi:2'-5' RNA ligase
MPPPIIVTLAVDPVSQDILDALRWAHFPPERNLIDAHVTLFHALDGAREREILDDIRSLETRPFAIQAVGLRSLGRGVAIAVASPALLSIRATLAARWSVMLTPQDRQKYQPHITIQNKVPPAEARALLASLQPTFTPFAISAIGLSAWHYLGGPWRLVQTLPFKMAPIGPEGDGAGGRIPSYG